MTMATTIVSSSFTTCTNQQQQQTPQQMHPNEQAKHQPYEANDDVNDANSVISKSIDPHKTMIFFEAIQNLDLDALAGQDLISVLPILTKLLLSKTFRKKQQLFKLLYPIKEMNDVIQLMLAKPIDPCETAYLPLESEFELVDCDKKLRLVAAEYINIHGRARQSTLDSNLRLLQSTLFDNHLYVDHISYCLCSILLKSSNSSMMNVVDMVEALLHVKYGTTYIIRLVANMPDYCSEICQSLIQNGERLDEGLNEVSEQRAKALRLICAMNPTISFTIKSMTLQACKMPSLTVMLTFDRMADILDKFDKFMSHHTNNDSEAMEVDEDAKNYKLALKELEDGYDHAIAFVTGILLGVDDGIRSWFAQFTKNAQTKRIDQSHHSILSKLRSQLIAYMTKLFPELIEGIFVHEGASQKNQKPFHSHKIVDKKLIRATATLRLYCALRGIGSLKLNSEENDILLRIITYRPPVNRTSVNFATTGVCTLLVCSSIINNTKEERCAAEWLKWLIKESNYSDIKFSSHGKCSISELLLLIATHFQNNQNNQIAELICATLGMKLQTKASVSKCKSLFVQEVFNDQMVAEHAIKVPVTKNLNNDITEFLPVHCIHQLLESRSFSKHQIPIKDWIYKQICESKKPIHNILPKLIEAYVNSVIVSTSVHGHCGTNEPLSEEEITRVFKTQLYSVRNQEDVNEPHQINGITNSATVDRPKVDKRKSKKDKELVESVDICEDKENHGGCNQDEPKIVDLEAAQVLLLYYLVLYEDVRLKKNAELSAVERAKLMKYSPDFMMEIPVFYLLQLVRDNQNSFGVILPSLLKLVTSQYPQLCSIRHWLTIDHYEQHCFHRENLNDHSKPTPKKDQEVNHDIKSTSKSKSAVITNAKSASKQVKSTLMKQLEIVFENLEHDPQQATKTIRSIASLKKEEIWPHVDIFINNLTRVISLNTNLDPEYSKLIQSMTELWWKFNTIFPRKLWVMTVNALRRPQNLRIAQEIISFEYSWDELALDPLIVLRCDSQVFRCTDTLNIILHILSAFLAASRRSLQDQINKLPGNQKDARNIEELKTTLILAQTSAAIQILLESCLPTDQEQEAINKRDSDIKLDADERMILEKFDKSVNCICEHLHQVFIADTNLAKLVHFQTYPSELLATTSDKIPSMHICLDFIPELLSQPDIAKQVFVIELTSHLCEKYAITKSLNVAKLCFNVAFTLLQLLPSERRALFFTPVLPALLRICKVFPILQEDADLILQQIEQITLAHIASTSSRLCLNSARPFGGLEKLSWTDAKKLMQRLDLNEALYLCIQKVLTSCQK